MTTQMTASCACKSFTQQIHFPTSSLPIPHALCLCTTCRSISGSCGLSYITIPSTQPFSPGNYNLTLYKSSQVLNRYFCSTCGAHVLCFHVPSKTWCLATGLWDRTEGIVRWTGCKFVEETRDGGVSVWLMEIDDLDGETRVLKRWMGNDTDNNLVPKGTLEKFSPPVKKDGVLKLKCHCGNVQYYITRPNKASKTVQSPLPDLIVPFHSQTAENSPRDISWWLRSNDTKYLAGTCTCDSCRLNSGYEIQTWAFIPKCNIFTEGGLPLDFEMGALKQYNSSKGVYREFCGVCGATVFWHNDDRPELIDVSAGLFDPEEGARVESWLEWWGDRVSFSEEAVSKSLIASLERGLKSWKQEP